ncbi:hypothetical protein F4776DRAFT_604124 [Hypoxylon sp. NC0597]|nr:hypothetical protein F4776DRAFT_604124 [Hypoxylon sp. NC0597]
MSSSGRGGSSGGGGGSSGGHSGDTPRGEKEMTGSNASGRRGCHHENTGTGNQKGGKKGGSAHHHNSKYTQR